MGNGLGIGDTPWVLLQTLVVWDSLRNVDSDLRSPGTRLPGLCGCSSLQVFRPLADHPYRVSGYAVSSTCLMRLPWRLPFCLRLALEFILVAPLLPLLLFCSSLAFPRGCAIRRGALALALPDFILVPGHENGTGVHSGRGL